MHQYVMLVFFKDLTQCSAAKYIIFVYYHLILED